MSDRSPEYLETIVRELCKLPQQTWVEFKNDNADPQQIGECISAALAPTQALAGGSTSR